MLYYSTNKKAPLATLEKAVVKGLAEDRGLYMPEKISKLPQSFFDHIDGLSFKEIARNVADAFFGEDVEPEALKRIVYDTLAFDCPIHKIDDNIYALELFHGPTLAFKDVGARFMARLLQYFIKRENEKGEVNVLVATSAIPALPWPTVSLVSTAFTSTYFILRVRCRKSKRASLRPSGRTLLL